MLHKKYQFTDASTEILYELRQAHIHWLRSEHKIDGGSFAGEIHLVHQNLNETNKTLYSVVGLMVHFYAFSF